LHRCFVSRLNHKIHVEGF